MLVKLDDLVTESLLINENELCDFILPTSLKKKFKDQLSSNNYFFDNYTSYAVTSIAKGDKPANYAIIPNQYFLIACKFYKIANELIKYYQIFDKIKNFGKLLNSDYETVFNNIKNNKDLYGAFHSFGSSDSDILEDIKLFTEFLTVKNLKIEFKKLFNEDGAPRTAKDGFASVILNIINLPAVSSSILGVLIYDLAMKPALYSDLVDYYKKIPNKNYTQKIILEEKFLVQFIYSVIDFLNIKNNINILINLLEGNDTSQNIQNLNLKMGDEKVTTFFKRSTQLLDDKTLKQGNELRFNPQPFKIGNNYYYLTTEWTYKDSRTNFLSFQKIFNSLYKDFQIQKNHAGNYVLLDSSCSVGEATHLPKPFLLLAGISGTGKSRFVKEQARLSDPNLNNFCMLSVRPDWHEPSDLLGYVSRILQPHYVVSEFLLFVIKAWKNAFDSADASKIVCKTPDQITPYWLCLDEMNLAPVEQYFADYLSVLETRQWDGADYICDPLLKASAFNFLDSKDIKIEDELKHALDLADPNYSGLWDYFKTTGIPIPPNLIVAGTVNMDETTHGFSRKVIDRALTIDFGAFFPNQLEEYFVPTTTPIALSFPVLSKVNKEDLASVEADIDGQKTIQFLIALNKILKGTPFELAYRALNELLISVVCFKPKDELELYAVWDDFLMTKVFPRLEGDSQKLKQETIDNQQVNLLTKLQTLVQASFKTDTIKDRPDLLRVKVASQQVGEAAEVANDSTTINITWRSASKLDWMDKRLQSNGFTSYWP